jgi:hypothetical protein
MSNSGLLFEVLEWSNMSNSELLFEVLEWRLLDMLLHS